MGVFPYQEKAFIPKFNYQGNVMSNNHDFEMCWQEPIDGRGCYLGVYLHNGKPTVDFYLESLYSDGGVNVLAELSYEELLSLHNTTKEMLNIINEK